jgi:hypothetical protein
VQSVVTWWERETPHRWNVHIKYNYLFTKPTTFSSQPVSLSSSAQKYFLP